LIHARVLVGPPKGGLICPPNYLKFWTVDKFVRHLRIQFIGED